MQTGEKGSVRYYNRKKRFFFQTDSNNNNNNNKDAVKQIIEGNGNGKIKRREKERKEKETNMSLGLRQLASRSATATRSIKILAAETSSFRVPNATKLSSLSNYYSSPKLYLITSRSNASSFASRVTQFVYQNQLKSKCSFLLLLLLLSLFAILFFMKSFCRPFTFFTPFLLNSFLFRAYFIITFMCVLVTLQIERKT